MEIPIVETERLILRGFARDDFPIFAKMWADPVLMHFLGGPLAEEDAWTRFMRIFGHWYLMGYGFWTVCQRSSDEQIGNMGFLNYKRNIQPSLEGMPEIGWSLVPRAHGKGYATEGAKAVLAWGEKHFGRVRTCCIIDPNNLPSIRVAERCGFYDVAHTTYKEKPIIVFHRDCE
jgi:RimJ/RimL family protein N-acetyltransferase